MVEINTFADNKLIPPEKIKQWETSRLLHVSKFLRGSSDPTARLKQADFDLEDQKQKLAEFKFALGEEEIRKRLGFTLRLTSLAMSIISFLSFGKRKYSIVELAIIGVDFSTEEFFRRWNLLMEGKDVKYDEMRIKSCADHYIIKTKDGVQEVIETTGGSPFPTQFFIRYDDEEGMKSKMDSSYDSQMVGVARTINGTVIGGVRHQLRKESDGLRLKALVEFPVLTADYMIKQHQYHLMCEFKIGRAHV